MLRKSPKRAKKLRRTDSRRVDEAPVDPSAHVMQAGKHMSLAEMHGAAPNESAQTSATPIIEVTPALGHTLPSHAMPAEDAAPQGEPVILGWSARARAVKLGGAEGNASARESTGEAPADLRPVPIAPA